MMESPTGPLLKTKLFMPQLRPEVVERPRLLTRLNAGIQGALTLVSAPAGFGKTTVLAEWATQTKDEGGRRKDEVKNFHPSAFIPHPSKVAWLSLDEGDNDPARFFSYFTAAVQTVLPGVGETALIALRSPQPPPLESILAGLINEITTATDSFALVLDDYHLIKARPVHQAMTFLIDHLPAQMRLVVATRTDPPLPLARLRGRGQLTELRAADLRFTTDETAAFLNQVMSLPLSGEDVAALETRTEGWIVGLQLAALSMKGRDDIAGFIASFTGNHRYVLDYLAEEVLHRQPEDVQTFLLYTSILNRLCGPLCDAVMERMKAEGGRMKVEEEKEIDLSSSFIPQPSSFMLEYLEQNNLFIVPLDDERCWYRYHHLFADLLRYQLGRLHAGQAAELHRRASLWHERHGLIAEALRHALNAGDWPRAADLVEQRGWPLLNQGEMMTVLGWITALPEELVRARPWLCLYHAWILVLTGQPDAVEPRLVAAGQNLPASPLESRDVLGHVAAIRAYAASIQGDAARVVELARQALQDLPEHDLPVRSVVSYTLGMGCLLAGDVPGACQALAEAGRLGQVSGNIHIAVPAICTLGGQQMALGRLHQAAETFQAALQLAIRRAGKFPPLAVRVYLELSELHYEWNDLECAIHYAAESIELGKQWGNTEAQVRAPLALAQALQAQGDLAGASAAFQTADEMMRRHTMSLWAASRVETCRVRLWLASGGGNLAAAGHWATARESALQIDGALPYLQEKEHLALARVLIAQGRHDDALGLLAQLHAVANAGGRMGRVIEILVLEAVARQARGEPEQARSTLEQALLLAEPEGYIRTFVDEGAAVASLLRRMKAEGGRRKEYIYKLLTTFEKDTDERFDVKDEKSFHPSSSPGALRPAVLHPLIEPLSERELEVLREIAAGLSNIEIAQRLVIAESTVKRHVHNIFGKLGVTTRTQALVKAKELQLS